MQFDLLSLDEAINKIKSNFKKIGNEDIFLENALGNRAWFTTEKPFTPYFSTLEVKGVRLRRREKFKPSCFKLTSLAISLTTRMNIHWET